MKSKISIAIMALAPIFAGAAGSFANTIDGLLDYINYLAKRALPLLILAALIMFLYGILRTFFIDRDHAAENKGRSFILWGIVALFVMVSVWGLVNVLRDTTGLDNNRVPSAPALPYPDTPTAGPGGIKPVTTQ